MTGPNDEKAPEHPEPTGAEPAAEQTPSGYTDDRTDSTPHPNTGGYQVPANPAVSGPYPVPGAQHQAYYSEATPSGPQRQQQQPPQQHYAQQYDQNLPPLQPQYQQQYPPQPQPGQIPLPQPQQGRHSQGGGVGDLSTAHLVKQIKRRPQSGWRKAVYVGSGKLINPGESPADTQRRELIARVNQPLRGCYKIAMLSLKGGVGKTTTTTTLGSTFASLRGDRVVAVDANPDRGTLSQ